MKGRRTAILMAALLLAAALAWGASLDCFRGHANGRVKGFDRIDPALFRAELRPEKFYNEVWFHEFQFPEESIVLTVHCQINNLGLSTGYGGIMTGFSDAKGMVFDEVEVDPEEVGIDPQGFGVSFGENRIELKGDTYRVHYQGPDIQADFTGPILVPGYQQGDGMVRFAGTEDFVRFNLPIPLASVEGTLTVKGERKKLKGRMCMNHDWQVLSPLRYMSDWRSLWLHTDRGTVNLNLSTSAELQGQWVKRLLVAKDGKNLFSSHDFLFEDLDLQPVAGSKIPCPRRYRISAVHGADRFSGEIEVNRIQEAYPVLSRYPYAFRKLAEMVVDESWLYRFWCDFDFTLDVGGEKTRIKGTGEGHFVGSLKAP